MIESKQLPFNTSMAHQYVMSRREHADQLLGHLDECIAINDSNENAVIRDLRYCKVVEKRLAGRIEYEIVRTNNERTRCIDVECMLATVLRYWW